MAAYTSNGYDGLVYSGTTSSTLSLSTLSEVEKDASRQCYKSPLRISSNGDGLELREPILKSKASREQLTALPRVSRLPMKSQSEHHRVPPPQPQRPTPLPEPHLSSDAARFPDGGLRAWLTVAGGFCCLFCSFGWINCIGVFQNYFETHQLRDKSPSQVSWISSLQPFIMFLCGPFVGKIIDNYGTAIPLGIGTVLQITGLMMSSISNKYYQFLLSQGILASIGAGFVFYPATTATASWFNKRRAFAFGIVTSGSSVGGVVLPIMVMKLVPVIGFGWTMRSAAFLLLALLIVANLTIRPRLPPQRRPFRLSDFISPLAEPAYLLVVCGTFMFFAGMFLPLNFIQLQAAQAGVPAQIVAYMIPILNAVSVVGRVLPGYVADRLGRFNMQIVMATFTAATVLGLWIPATGAGNVSALVAFAALYGFGMGAFVTLIPAVIAQITPDVRRIGVRQGTAFAVVSIAALIGNPVGGVLISAMDGNYTALMVFTGGVQVAGAVLILGARLTVTGRVLWKRV